MGHVGSTPEYEYHFAKILEDAVHKAVETFPAHGEEICSRTTLR